MGCTSAKERRPDLMKMNTVTGRLNLTVTSAQVTHETSVFKMDPYVKIKLSNQEYSTKAIPKGDKHPVFNETFSFHINSCFKNDGRNLQVMMMDKNKVGGDKKIGFGIVDLDPIINMKKTKQTFRCFLNFDSKPAGFVNFIAEFVEETAKTISFRFQTATIRRKTSTFGTMNCWVHIIIGQEQLKTEKNADTKEHSPTWFNQIVAFNISESIPECKISLYDDKTLVGTTTIPVKELLKTNEEQTFNEELIYKDASAGTIVFQTRVGTNPIFSIIKAVHSKINDTTVHEKKQSDMKQSKALESNPEAMHNSELKKTDEKPSLQTTNLQATNLEAANEEPKQIGE